MTTPTSEILIPAWRDGILMPVEKLDVHRLGLRHKAISVFVTAGSQLLIQRRALGKYHTPGLWANTCCSHPYWGETPEACARRRIREELGVDDLRLHRRTSIEYRAAVGDGLIEHEVVEVFTAEADPTLPIRPDPTEVMATRWIELEALDREIAETPERFTPWLRIYLQDYRTRIFGTSRGSLAAAPR